MDDLRTLMESIGEIAYFAGILDERRHAPALHMKPALSAEAKSAKHAARQEKAASKKSREKGVSHAARAEPTQALSRKQRKQAKHYAAQTKKPSTHHKKKGDHKFANETTFKRERGGSHDPGGAMVSTSGLRAKLSKDPKRFLKFPAGSKRGRYPVRGGNRASLAGTLRQASKRDPFLYRKAVARIKESPGNMMHRKHDPSTKQSNVERPVPLGGPHPIRPHGHGGLPPDPGPHLKADKKKAKGREEKHETSRKHARKRANKDKFREAVTGRS